MDGRWPSSSTQGGENAMDRIAVLIPCYNEEKTVEKVVLDFKKALPDAVVYVYPESVKLSSRNTSTSHSHSCA